MHGAISKLALFAVAAGPLMLATPATGDPLYPKFDIGSTAPADVTSDIETLIGECAARWSSPEWRTLLDLWDPDEATPYYLFSHQPDWLIGWDQMRAYFSETPCRLPQWLHTSSPSSGANRMSAPQLSQGNRCSSTLIY